VVGGAIVPLDLHIGVHHVDDVEFVPPDPAGEDLGPGGLGVEAPPLALAKERHRERPAVGAERDGQRARPRRHEAVAFEIGRREIGERFGRGDGIVRVHEVAGRGGRSPLRPRPDCRR
jgi:hypothetical protein